MYIYIYNILVDIRFINTYIYIYVCIRTYGASAEVCRPRRRGPKKTRPAGRSRTGGVGVSCWKWVIETIPNWVCPRKLTMTHGLGSGTHSIWRPENARHFSIYLVPLRCFKFWHCTSLYLVYWALVETLTCF